MANTLRLVLGDQLSLELATLADADKSSDVVLMCEVGDEARYVKHHKKKIAFLFAAMRHHAVAVRASGYVVDYVELDDAANTQSLAGEVERAVERHGATTVVVTEAGEYRLHADMQTWAQRLGIGVDIRPDDRFFCSLDGFAEWARGRKQLRMEYFYRSMRRAHGYLMDGDQPLGGQWNYDAANRSAYDGAVPVPKRHTAEPDEVTRAVLALVESRFPEHFGDLEPFTFATTRAGALEALTRFVDACLPHFGTYQDAMVEGEPFLFHGLVSMYLNCGLLSPREVCDRAQQAYARGNAPLNAVEGFIRQILGWREFVRGVYWLEMPDYAERNTFGARDDLPVCYWTGETDMNCVRQVVSETRANAFAHHIQRLMVTGNFALLAGIDPKQVCAWYLIVYADAYEWVELPNTLGMALFGDEGVFASKPYAASGAYINRMSDYCKQCRYSVTHKTGEKACPFNYLYWDFMMRNRARLEKQPRMAMPLKTLDRFSEARKTAIKADSARFLERLERD